MLETTTDGHVVALPKDLSVSDQEPGMKIEFYLSDEDAKVLQHAAWVDGRTVHQQARVFCLHMMGRFRPWQPDPKTALVPLVSPRPSAPGASGTKRKR